MQPKDVPGVVHGESGHTWTAAAIHGHVGGACCSRVGPRDTASRTPVPVSGPRCDGACGPLAASSVRSTPPRRVRAAGTPRWLVPRAFSRGQAIRVGHLHRDSCYSAPSPLPVTNARPGPPAPPIQSAQFPSLECFVQPEVRMSGFDPRWSDDVRGGGRHRDGGGAEIGREVPRGGGGSGGPEREAPNSRDPRDVFVNHVDLPRGRTREYVHSLREPYLLRGSESRALATVGAFRVVPAGDMRDADGRPLDPDRGELHHLRRQGLVETVPSPGRDRSLVVLTHRGRELLNSNRHQDREAAWHDEASSTAARPPWRDPPRRSPGAIRDEQGRSGPQASCAGVAHPQDRERQARRYRGHRASARALLHDDARILDASSGCVRP